MNDDDIVARLRSPATVFYEYDADNGDLLDAAADEIERLRAELAAERERARKPIVYSPNAQAMSDRVKAAEAERDALRALLKEARDIMVKADIYFPLSIDRALKGEP